MYCKNCGKELKSENKFCPFCGAETGNMAEPVSLSDGQKKPKKKIWMVLPAVLAAICIAFGVYRAVNTVSENDPEEKGAVSAEKDEEIISDEAQDLREQWVATVEEDGKWYVINGKNEKLAEIALEDILFADDFNEHGIASVRLGHSGEEKISYINTEGEVLVDPFEVENANEYMSGASPIKSGENWCCGRGIFEENGKFGFIDVNGEVKVSPVYDEVYGFGKNGLAAVRVDELWGFVDTEGEMVIAPSYLLPESFSDNGLALVITQDGDQCFIDGNGEIIMNPGYNIYTSDYIIMESFDENGFARVKRDGMWGIMNEDGVMITEPVFDYIYSCDKDRICICVDDRYGLMDTQGTICLEPVYDDLSPLNDKFYAVSMDDQWGVIDQNGKEIVKPAYETIYTLGKKKWVGISDEFKKACLIETDGTVVKTWESDWQFFYSKVYNRESNEELFGVKTNGAWIFIDDESRVRMKTKETFDFRANVISFTGGPILVWENGVYGYIDSNGELMIDPQYEDARDFFDKGSLD